MDMWLSQELKQNEQLCNRAVSVTLLVLCKKFGDLSYRLFYLFVCLFYIQGVEWQICFIPICQWEEPQGPSLGLVLSLK